jgi:hypothetical protein
MTPFQQLQIEYPGIKAVIFEYSSGGCIGNYVKALGSAIEKADGEAILYCLNGIDQWYEENMEKIQENDYVYNQDEHEKTQSLIKNLLGQLSGFDFSSLKASSLPGNVDQTPLIFLSHCSKDKKYGDALEALIMGLGVQPEQLIYTSHPLHKIPLGENIYDYLRKCMNQNIYMIILWSKSYLESPACLNEMGAAWVKQSNYVGFFTPDFDFGAPKFHQCVIGVSNIGAVLKPDSFCRESMLEFRNHILTLFGLKIDEKKWTYLLDNFITAIS